MFVPSLGGVCAAGVALRSGYFMRVVSSLSVLTMNVHHWQVLWVICCSVLMEQQSSDVIRNIGW